MSVVCSFNDLSTAVYTSLRANAALDSVRRSHRRKTRKAAGLSVDMVGEILVSL